MAQGPRVPQFGTWGSGENAPNYTSRFTLARKGRGVGLMINPNDPQQNPHMFPNTTGTKVEPEPIRKGGRGNVRRVSTSDKSRHQSRTKSANRGDETVGNQAGGLAWATQTPGPALCGLGWIKQRKWCWKQREESQGVEMPEGGALVPPFGIWDVKNPESEDFTGKFKRVQAEHNGPGKSPGELGTPRSSFTTQKNQNTHDNSVKPC